MSTGKATTIQTLLALAFSACLMVDRAWAVPVALQSATATFSQTGFSVVDAIDGSTVNGKGWAIDPFEVNQVAVFETTLDAGFAGGTTLTFTLDHTFFRPDHALGRFRLSATTDDRSTFADGLTSGGDVIASWTVLDPFSFTSVNGIAIADLVDNSLLVTENDTSNDVYTVKASTTLTGITGFRLEVIENAGLPYSGPGLQDANGNFVLTEFTVDATAAPVPEPSTLLLLGTGVLGLAARLRRKS